jgi:hypothetical protein
MDRHRRAASRIRPMPEGDVAAHLAELNKARALKRTDNRAPLTCGRSLTPLRRRP